MTSRVIRQDVVAVRGVVDRAALDHQEEAVGVVREKLERLGGHLGQVRFRVGRRAIVFPGQLAALEQPERAVRGV